MLPRLARTCVTVRVGLGWFGPLSPALAVASSATGLAEAGARPPPDGVRTGPRPARAADRRRVLGRPRRGCPGAHGSLVVADARDERGERVAHVELEGPNVYTLTGDLMAWAARQLSTSGPAAAGALGPVDAFGLDTLQAACGAAGLVERVEREGS